MPEDEPGGLRGETPAWRWDDLALDAGTIAIAQTFSKQRPWRRKPRAAYAKFLHPVSEATAEWRAGGTAENAALRHRLKILELAAGRAVPLRRPPAPFGCRLAGFPPGLPGRTPRPSFPARQEAEPGRVKST